jgi:hypothetical protein
VRFSRKINYLYRLIQTYITFKQKIFLQTVSIVKAPRWIGAANIVSQDGFQRIIFLPKLFDQGSDPFPGIARTEPSNEEGKNIWKMFFGPNGAKLDLRCPDNFQVWLHFNDPESITLNYPSPARFWK